MIKIFYISLLNFLYIILHKIIINENNHKKLTQNRWYSKRNGNFLITPQMPCFFEKKILGLPYGRFSNFLNIESNWYGHLHAISKFSGIEKHKLREIAIEHGNILSKRYIPEVVRNYKDKKILTFSSERKFFLSNELKLNSYAIGPYIHYSNNPYSDAELISIKSRLGNVITHFPFINYESDSNNLFDHKECIKSLNYLKNNNIVDTVIVCFYWKDLLENCSILKEYTKVGFKSACCGTILNPYFLNHLKFILSISDYSSSNIVSTPLGYSLFMGVKHITMGINSSKLYYKKYDPLAKMFYETFHFENYKNELFPSKEVLDNVALNYGFADIKDKKQITNILIQ